MRFRRISPPRGRTRSGIAALLRPLVAILGLWLAMAGLTPAADLGPIRLLTLEGGAPMFLAAYHGKFVLANFWATWCVPCRYELPELESLQRQFAARNVVVVGITAETETDKVRRFLAKYPVSYPILVDPQGELHKAVDVTVMPSTALLDPQGRIVEIFRGFERAEGLQHMKERLQAALGEQR